MFSRISTSYTGINYKYTVSNAKYSRKISAVQNIVKMPRDVVHADI
jgi:hypothetical protein